MGDGEPWDAHAGLLDAGELASARRALRIEVRRQRVFARSALRRILSAQVGRPPAELALVRSGTGKPELAGGDGVRFSLSHSGRLVLVAVTSSVDVGVDLEERRGSLDCDQLAHAVCAPDELARWRAQPPGAARRAALLALWTRKEAILKAAGVGLAVDPARIRVPSPARGSADVAPASGLLPEEPYRVRDLEVGEGSAAALAYPGPERGIVLHTLEPWAG
jgi:4'-phosphopantetheinyl transferase